MDLFTKDARRDPFPLYEQLREIQPVLRDPRSGFWLLLDYSGCRQALGDSAGFSSNLAEFARQPTPPWMIFSDPPRHSALRSLVARAFTPKLIAKLEARIGEITSQLLTRAMNEGQMDFASGLAVPLPMYVIADIIGIPTGDWELFRSWSNDILALSETLQGREAGQAAGARFHRTQTEMGDYIDEFIARQTHALRRDLLAGLLEAGITRDELMSFLELLLVGGSETTTNLLNNAILCLLEQPGEFERLRANAAVLPSAIEEVLRYRSPLQFVFRATRNDVSVQGHTIPAGELVLVVLGAANRDSAIFQDACRFDIGRTPNPHLAFGYGVHFCLGAWLARLEARIALTEFFRRVSYFESAATGPLEPRSALHVLGPESLPLRYTAMPVKAVNTEAYA